MRMMLWRTIEGELIVIVKLSVLHMNITAVSYTALMSNFGTTLKSGARYVPLPLS